jgi:hypothetical protein
MEEEKEQKGATHIVAQKEQKGATHVAQKRPTRCPPPKCSIPKKN